MTRSKNKFSKLLFAIIACLSILSCQKEIDNGDLPVQAQPVDLATKVNSSVSGFVTDEHDAVMIGATVKVGGTSTTTDKYGYFEINNVLVVKNAAVVTVTRPGYFNGIKTYIAAENKAAFFRIKLIRKANSGTINAASGGNVTLGNGLIVSLPANSVVIASSGTAYTGAVDVASHWIDPTAADLHQTMPGDLRGIATDGSLKTLTTNGMAAVELTAASGELLQIAPGKKATLTLSIPASIQATAPATIPLWSFDETKGLWKEEGQATKNGSTYVGEVSHFSFWNCDVPSNYVQFDCTIKNMWGGPMPYVIVRISVVGSPANAAYGYTDANGFVQGAVPNNAQLQLEVFGNYCATSLHTQTFTTSNVNLSLGIINVNNPANSAMVTGTVTDCNNNPVTNGYIIIINNGVHFRHPLGAGGYAYYMALCNNATDVMVIAEDATSSQQSAPVFYTLVPGTNTIGNLQACGVSIQQFFNYSLNGGATVSFTLPADSLIHTGNGSILNSIIQAAQMPGNDFASLAFDNTGIAAGSIQTMQSFYSSQINSTTTTTTGTINITEYGAVGQFIAGNFTGAIVTTMPPSTTYAVSGNFRVRRNF